MIKLLWTKSKLPLGPLITWGLDEPVSHFAVEFFGKIVIHSNFYGVHPTLSPDFYKWSKVVYQKEYATGDDYAARLFVSILNNYWGKKYDWKWFWGLVRHALVYKLTGRPIPDEIKTRSRDKYLCTEVVEFLTVLVGSVDVGNGSPFLLAKRLGVVK